MQIALSNNKVMRAIGGQVQGPPEFLLRNPSPGPHGLRSRSGRKQSRTRAWKRPCRPSTRNSAAALMWQRVDAPNNYNRFDGLGLLLPFDDREDIGTFQAKLSKVTATGGQFSLTHEVDYDEDQPVQQHLDGLSGRLERETHRRNAATVVARQRHRVQPHCRARGKAGAIQRRRARPHQYRHRPGRFRNRRAESHQRRGNEPTGNCTSPTGTSTP